MAGIYNVVPNQVGKVQDLAELTSKLGADPIENWQGVDFGVNARLRNGLTIQGGTSTGRTLQDNCALRSLLPETYPWSTIDVTQSLRGDSVAGLTSPYCRIVTPYQSSVRGLATYTIPKVDIQLAATWRSDPGAEIQANETVTNAIANSGPQPLGRNLSSGNITVNLIPQGTLYGPRINNIDFRVAKVFRFGRTRTQLGVDVYNILNSDTVLTYNLAYVAPTATSPSNWLTPSTIATARYVKVNFQIDF